MNVGEPLISAINSLPEDLQKSLRLFVRPHVVTERLSRLTSGIKFYEADYIITPPSFSRPHWEREIDFAYERNWVFREFSALYLAYEARIHRRALYVMVHRWWIHQGFFIRERRCLNLNRALCLLPYDIIVTLLSFIGYMYSNPNRRQRRAIAREHRKFIAYCYGPRSELRARPPMAVPQVQTRDNGRNSRCTRCVTS